MKVAGEDTDQIEFDPIPRMRAVHTTKWATRVLMLDSATRVSEMRAVITGTFGEVLKLDSTKKVMLYSKKLRK